MGYVDRCIVAGSVTSTGNPVVMTSPDGLTWTEVASWPGAQAANVNIVDDTYFVVTAAPSSLNNYAWSTDGDNWTLDTAPPALITVAYTGTHFVTLTATNSYRTTTRDGTWAGPTSTGTSGGSPRRLHFRGGLLVGCLATSTDSPLVYSSDNGASWTEVDPIPGRQVYDLDYGAGRYIAGTRSTSSTDDDWIITSTNGTSWSTVATGTDDHTCYAVRYGNGRFVGIGADGSGPPQVRTFTSTNGTTWTVNTPTGLPATGGFSTSQLAFWNGRFIWISNTNGTIYTSTDGVTWSGQTFTDRTWAGVAAGVARPVGGWFRGHPWG